MAESTPPIGAAICNDLPHSQNRKAITKRPDPDRRPKQLQGHNHEVGYPAVGQCHSRSPPHPWHKRKRIFPEALQTPAIVSPDKLHVQGVTPPQAVTTGTPAISLLQERPTHPISSATSVTHMHSSAKAV